MTEHKLLKYLSKPFEFPTGKRKLTPVVISDSKGLYLQRATTSNFETQIKWWCAKSRTSAQGLSWLTQNLDQKIQHLHNISAYVWLGTCDLTQYNKGVISLKTESDEAINSLLSNLNKIVELFQRYPESKITFIEIPVYSIYEWNKSRNHTDPNQFLAQDEKLLEQVLRVNDKIRELNTTLNSRAPNINADLKRSNLKSSKNQHKRIRDQYNWTLHKDGVHPKRNLSRVWLRKFSTQIKADCW
ncbi:unnamed protein product [Mytilus edulis]|uniref:Uncharacterized protein n=1 Tax=Mytilus edulis TaxID=6550 RepID=A0A8S3VR96_MYTED|nr:unnamed protein product [Mytilus edulis]